MVVFGVHPISQYAAKGNSTTLCSGLFGLRCHAQVHTTTDVNLVLCKENAQCTMNLVLCKENAQCTMNLVLCKENAQCTMNLVLCKENAQMHHELGALSLTSPAAALLPKPLSDTLVIIDHPPKLGQTKKNQTNIHKIKSTKKTSNGGHVCQ
jgi:hypothetical protein